MSSIIGVQNLGKKYLIRHQETERYTTLRDIIANKSKSLGRKILHPLVPSSLPFAGSSREELWALKDVSFEVNQGDRIGIIGRNGAGKTTLLKLLGRITEPTTGRVAIKGRIASLLEVGTGFHPELTGRENIFLNGAILGMSKVEIKKKFDEIVDFAEIEKFLDTPVKRYSSGMYVRLAFAVAAHLEAEILLVDEVLAVGDTAFQRKCLCKMGDVAKEGRTILFVSHNMGAIQQLCNGCILLDQGRLKNKGLMKQVIENYLHSSSHELEKDLVRKGNKKIIFDEFSITDKNGVKRTDFFMGDTVWVNFSLVFKDRVKSPVIAIEIRNSLNECFAHLMNHDDNYFVNTSGFIEKIRIRVEITQILFTPSRYFVSLWVGEDIFTVCDYVMDCLYIDLIQGEAVKRQLPYPTDVKVFLNSKWSSVEK